jgi:hypothetical protein
MSGHLKNILTLTAAALVALALLSTLLTWTGGLAPVLKERLAERAAEAPKFKEARQLAITYEAAMEDPQKVLGRHVLWCVHISSANSFVGMGSGKPLDITNQGVMPVELFKRQSGDFECQNALLEITGVKTYDFAGARAVRLQTRYIDHP